MKTRFNHVLLIAGILCFAIMLAGCALTVNQVKKDPTAQVIKAIDNTIESLKADIPFTMPKNLDKEGTVDMKITGIPDFDDGITVNYAYKIDDDAMSLSVAAGAIGDIELCYKNGEYALSSDMLPDKGVIGFDNNTIKEDLKDSALLELFGISYDELLKQLESSFVDVKDYAEASVNFEKAVKDILVNCETEVAEQAVKTNGEDAKAICVTYNMDKDAYIAFADAYKNLLGNMYGGMLNEYSEMFDEMTDEIENSDVDSKLTFAINPGKKVIMQVSLDITATVDGEKDSASFVLDLGKIPANSDKFTMEIKDAENTSSVIYDRTEKDGKLCRNITLKDSENDSNLEFVYDKDNGGYTLTFSGSEGGVISGTLKSSETEMNIAVDKIEMPGAEGADMSASMTVKNTADVKDMPDYKKITDMTADELTTVITSFAGMFPSIYDNSYSDMYEFDPTYDYNQDGIVNEEDEEYFNNYFGDSDMKYYEFDSTYDYNFDGIVNDGDKAYFDKYYGEDSDYSYIIEFDPAFDYDCDGDLDDDDKVFFDTYYSNIGDLM